MTNKELINNLKKLKDVEAAGSPALSWVDQNRQIMMSQINPAQQKPVKEESFYYFQYIYSLFQQKVVRPVAVAMVVVLLFLGYTATITVANASLPGDPLYPIKTVSEKVQLALTFSEEKKVELQVSFINRRVDEIKRISLTEQDTAQKVDKINQVAKQITDNTNNVKATVSRIGIAAEKIDLVRSLGSQVEEIEKNIIEAKNALSDEVKQEVDQEMNGAIASTGQVGTATLSAIVAKYEQGTVEITEAEVTNRIADRIATLDSDLLILQQMISQNTTSSQALTDAGKAELVASSTRAVVDQQVAAQALLEEAKQLLADKKFSQVLEKSSQAKELILEAIKALAGIKEIINSIIELESGQNIDDSGSGQQVLGTSTDNQVKNAGSSSSSETVNSNSSPAPSGN